MHRAQQRVVRPVHARGLVQLAERDEVRVLSAGTVDDPVTEIAEASSEVADYVVFAEAPQREPMAMPVAAARKPKDDAASSGGAEEAGAEPTPTENPEGLRPAFGFMPEYSSEGDGVLVGQVFEGRPAFEAGIEQGDRIMAIGGKPTLDLEEYTEVLDTLIIGRTVTVRVRREVAEVDLQVKVGSRAAR